MENNSFEGKEECVECRKKYYKFSSILWDSKIRNVADIVWKDSGVNVITKILNVLNGILKRLNILEERALLNSFDIVVGNEGEDLELKKVVGEFEYFWGVEKRSLIIKTTKSLKSIKNDYTGEEYINNFNIEQEDMFNIYRMSITKPFSTKQKIIIK